ncbi:hypothetical protein [Amycolatopsis thermoflava]|uniref:hypothetical protein n=1 Tax=Amycolatopsis thermoflava TaxID=84480 RepID=UPI00041C909F|nr:hypothetical protein [Amycolatopsis thermoflava]
MTEGATHQYIPNCVWTKLVGDRGWVYQASRMSQIVGLTNEQLTFPCAFVYRATSPFETE